jgi:hypothetical protein
MPTQVLTVKALEKALSASRLAGYCDRSAGEGDVEAVARYLWNLALQAALSPALHMAEVTIRNAVFDAAAKVAATHGRPFKDVHCWLDTRPSLLYTNEEQAVESAKTQLRQSRLSMTPGHLVAKLSFGFWINLLNASYEQGRASGPALWPAALKEFHNVPKMERTRGDLRRRFDSVRAFRNRLMHHEPLWDRDPAADYAHLLETLHYLNPGVGRAVAELCRFPLVLRDGHQAYLDVAAYLIGHERRVA